jgi:hypothetical protein
LIILFTFGKKYKLWNVYNTPCLILHYGFTRNILPSNDQTISTHYIRMPVKITYTDTYSHSSNLT